MKKKDNAAQIVSIQYYHSPCGELILASMSNALCLCDWNGMPCAERNKLRIGRYVNADFRIAPSPVIEQAKRQLDEYFAGKRKEFHIPLHPVGTVFQLRYGGHCSISHTEKQETTWKLLRVLAMKKACGPWHRLSAPMASAYLSPAIASLAATAP